MLRAKRDVEATLKIWEHQYMNNISLSYLKSINRSAWQKLLALFMQDLTQRGVDAGKLSQEELLLLFSYHFEEAVKVEEDPQALYGDTVFLLERKEGLLAWEPDLKEWKPTSYR